MDVWYRLEDRRYSVADEYGDHAYTSYDVQCLEFWVIKRTPKGVWLKQKYGPNPPTVDSDYLQRVDKRFQLLESLKRFACPTLAEAIESYKARKKKQISIYTARVKSAEFYIQIAEAKYGSNSLRRPSPNT